MENIFPEPILKLPVADIPLEGYTAFLSQPETHQILFMQFDEDTILPEHAHEAQVGFVLEGQTLTSMVNSRSIKRGIAIISQQA